MAKLSTTEKLLLYTVSLFKKGVDEESLEKFLARLRKRGIITNEIDLLDINGTYVMGPKTLNAIKKLVERGLLAYGYVTANYIKPFTKILVLSKKGKIYLKKIENTISEEKRKTILSVFEEFFGTYSE
ncbi:MAG: hypothetical protein DRJ63_02525 [Thermoprotei archaeon]|nr:MAG: hypothetical protein DRJ63_02525 [Thermoprotei archaeon]